MGCGHAGFVSRIAGVEVAGKNSRWGCEVVVMERVAVEPLCKKVELQRKIAGAVGVLLRPARPLARVRLRPAVVRRAEWRVCAWIIEIDLN